MQQLDAPTEVDNTAVNHSVSIIALSTWPSNSFSENPFAAAYNPSLNWALGVISSLPSKVEAMTAVVEIHTRGFFGYLNTQRGDVRAPVERKRLDCRTEAGLGVPGEDIRTVTVKSDGDGACPDLL